MLWVRGIYVMTSARLIKYQKTNFFVTRGKFDLLKFLNEWYIVRTTDVSTFANECQGQSGR